MIKSLTDIENEMPEKIRLLVKQGCYALEKEEQNAEFRNLFYATYECEIFAAEMQPVPIQFDKEKNTFQFLDRFAAYANHLEFNAWKEMFLERSEEDLDDYNDYLNKDYYEGIESEVDEEDDLEPVLDYRNRNEFYIEHALHQLTGLPVSEEAEDVAMDEYGWIEDRMKNFVYRMADMCTEFVLPRLPIIFDSKEQMPFFDASNEEIKNFKSLLQKRVALDTNARNVLEEEYRNDCFSIDDNLSHHQKNELQEAYRQKNLTKRCALSMGLMSKWESENTNYVFPSKVKQYEVELMGDFNENEIQMIPKEELEHMSRKVGFDLKGLTLN